MQGTIICQPRRSQHSPHRLNRPSTTHQQIMSTNAAGDPPQQRVTIDEDGDLTLRVGEGLTCQTSELIVCSSAMRRASPIWKKMLFGGFRESKPAEGEWVVALPDDDPAALSTLLHLVHANCSEKPRRLDMASLYNLVVVMDKYDTLRFMRPWKDDWLATVKGASRAKSGPTLCMGRRTSRCVWGRSQPHFP